MSLINIVVCNSDNLHETWKRIWFLKILNSYWKSHFQNLTKPGKDCVCVCMHIVYIHTPNTTNIFHYFVLYEINCPVARKYDHHDSCNMNFNNPPQSSL